MAENDGFERLINEVGGEKPWRDKRVLAHLHVAHRLEYSEIADILECNEYTVGEWCRKLDVEFPWRVEDVLRTMYHTHCYSSVDLCEKWNVAKSAILKHIRRFGIETRDVGTRVEYPRLHDVDWLREKYVEEHLSTHIIADMVGCDKAAVMYHLEKNDIPIKESNSDYTGSLNQQYQGGGDFIRAVRHKLSGRQIDWKQTAKQLCESAKSCELCGASDVVLNAHHIIPIATGGVNEKSLLMPLCDTCHRRVERYTERFTERHLVD